MKVLLCLVASLLGACDGVGRSVVDRFSSDVPMESDCAQRRARCEDADATPRELTNGTRTAPLSRCVVHSPPDEPIISVLRDCVLTIEASEEVERAIVASSLDNVQIVVGALVHLRITDSDLFRVTLETEGAQSPIEGTTQLSHCDVRASKLSAPKLELISTFTDLSSVTSDELSAIDLQSRESLIFAASGMISSSRLRATRLSDCENLLIAESQLMSSRIDACSELTRLYDVEATGCAIDGMLESDGSTFAQSRFGVADFTQMYGWDTGISTSIFCEGFDNLHYSGGSIACTSCEGALAARDADVCFDTSATNLESNGCRTLVVWKNVCDDLRRKRPASRF